MPVRELALRILHRFDTAGVYVRDTLDAALRHSGLDSRDRALATELVNGTLRWRGRIDWVLQQAVRRDLETLTPWIRNILRLGVYQILLLDRVPAAAATHEAVELAKRYGHPGTARLTNAVLRTVIRQQATLRYPTADGDPIAHLMVVYSYPRWIAERWLGRYGLNGAIALCQAGNTSPPVVVRTNRLRTETATLRSSLCAAGLQVEPGRYLDDSLIVRDTGDMTTLEAFARGWFQVQDESAGLAVRLLDPQEGETILDLCCAPGGKATDIADRMRNRGLIVGVDLKLSGLRRLRDHCERLGITIVRPVVADGRRWDVRGRVDRVLVDAPCSGLGTIARRAELRWRRTLDDLAALQGTQLALLEQAAYLVKPGGVIVYSTCTIEPDENEAVIMAFCARHPEFQVERPPDTPSFPSGLMDAQGVIRTLPSVHGIDGSFAVRLKRCPCSKN